MKDAVQTKKEKAKEMINEMKEDRGKSQARAQLESIIEMVNDLTAAEGNSEKEESAQQRIQEDPLSVEVRSAWCSSSSSEDYKKPAEYCILLCTGGPACRIVGGLDEYCQAESAKIEYQDWFTPWNEYRMTGDEEKTVIAYANQFYFGE